MISWKYIIFSLLVMTGWAHAENITAPIVSQLAPIPNSGHEIKAKLAVDPIKIGLLPGDELGHATLGLFCINSQQLTVTDAFMKNYGNFMSSVVTQEMKKLGYTFAGLEKSSAFDTDVAGAPDYRVGGILKDLKIEICQTGQEAEGWVYAKIDWALYSEKMQKVLFQKTTEGLAKSTKKIPDLAKNAITSSIDNFVAEPEFLANLKTEHDVTGTNVSADNVPETANSVDSGTTVKAGRDNTLELVSSPTLPGGAQKNQAKLREAVVTLETASGTGSGFYIHRDGYLLTDFHVINGAKFAKVKLQNGDKLVARVVKVNEHDDVALLKSDPVEFNPLSIRKASIDVGEDVYAIGSPLGVLTSSMTHGVLSADRVIQGIHVLQSDAAVTFGSSGGPLLDTDGRVIGITKSRLNGESGFNLFIPILDALHAVDTNLK